MSLSRKRFGLVLAALLLVAAHAGALVLALGGCARTVPNRSPVSEPFPAAKAEALDGKAWDIPADFRGEPAIFLIGYVQESQFDIDRWLLGLLQLETPVEIRELPAAAGMVPAIIDGTIDQGMRSGIPSEDWGAVITLYGSSADKLVEFTGNENPRNARAVLLDAEGKVAWFHDRGYSAAKGLELDAAARELKSR